MCVDNIFQVTIVNDSAKSNAVIYTIVTMLFMHVMLF